MITAFAVAPAVIAAVANRLEAPAAIRATLLIPALWTLSEWLRHFTAFRFPWAHLGYSQLPGSPLAPMMPIVGTLGMSFTIMALGGLLALLVLQPSAHRRMRTATAIVAIFVLARLAGSMEWTRPVGAPVPVAMLQDAFPMTEKFQAKTVAKALRTYAAFALESKARIVLTPETALPLVERQIPESYLHTLEHEARRTGRDVLVSFFRDAGNTAGYHSSARVLGVSGPQDYDKRILVPFGEYIPAPGLLRPLYVRIANVPMLDTVPGNPDQDTIILGGNRVALRMCFEDMLGAAYRDETAQARFLVILANDSWDGSDTPMHQHLQAARTRALEAAKPVVRVANTGWSALIAPDGRIEAAAPPNRPALLEVLVQPREGVTPYIRYGDSIPVGIALLALIGSLAAVRSVGQP